MPNFYLHNKIKAHISTANTPADDLLDPRTELDSHANMVVLGKNCFVFDNVNGRTCDVVPFDRTIGTVKEVPIVDAAIAYDCPFAHQSFLLIIRNALYIPTKKNNLIPPFILREALHGIFSYFHTRTPTIEEIKHSEPILLTPDSDQ